MWIDFTKYQGTGNDFIILDDRTERFPAQNHSIIKQLCDRRFGVGADGFILLRNTNDADFEMLFYNADGKPGSLCGNGSRCAVGFAIKLGIIVSPADIRFLFLGKIYQATADTEITLFFQDCPAFTPVSNAYFVDNGSPHHLQFVGDLETYDVTTQGRIIRESDAYPQGTNVNFIEIVDPHHIRVRTYERGVEAETLSCGTGATAAALLSSVRQVESPVTVHTAGGELTISYGPGGQGRFRDVRMTGPAEAVFEGRIKISTDEE